MKVAYVVVSSYVGISIGAEHLYADLRINGGENIRLERVMGLEEAKRLDEKDQSGGIWECLVTDGDGKTERFNSMAEIKAEAIPLAKQMGIDWLEAGNPIYVEPVKILLAPSDFPEVKLTRCGELFSLYRNSEARQARAERDKRRTVYSFKEFSLGSEALSRALDKVQELEAQIKDETNLQSQYTHEFFELCPIRK